MLRNQSVPVSTVDNVEFINLSPSDISPLVSKCEIKVMYVGKNRNGSYIDRQTAVDMAKTLRSVPIVGCYKEDLQDFGDHGEVLTIEDGEVKFSCKTVPYGFVSPDAEVWFQRFDDVNEFGERTTREYLMTTGYLWTGQFPEANRVIEKGNGQSMEIDIADGHWAQDQDEMEFFIINDAIFTKLCILGDDVEPCFEGASVTSPEVSKNFSYEQKFSHTLFAMMNELKNALNEKGGSRMAEETEITEVIEEGNVATEEFVAAKEEKPEDKKKPEDKEKPEDKKSEEESEKEEAEDEDKKKFKAESSDEKEDEKSEEVDEESEEEDKKKFKKEEDKEEEKEDSEEENPADEEKKEEKPAEKHSLEAQVSELSAALGELADKFSALEAEAKELREFKAARINEDKDALIAKYHMLSDEDKADIIANKEQFTLSEIESKLALLYVKKNVDFETVDGKKEEASEAAPLTTFSLNEDIAEDVDPMLNALRAARNL